MHGAISDLPSFIPRYDFVGDMDELIEDWVGQKPMRDIASDHLRPNTDMNRFQRDLVADYFGYKLPWGIASFMGIANWVLDLDGLTTESAHWLVPMVRYGVATRTAAWAMTVGCPTRELSTTIAEAFAEHNSRGTYQEFVSWFSNLTDEDFILGMNATPDEASVLVSRAAALVPDGAEVTARLRINNSEYVADVAGLQHDRRWTLLPAVTIGDSIELQRDYDNPYDVNAILVRHEAGDLGYISRDVARLLAPQMDIGSVFHATVSSIERGDSRRVQLSIALEAGDGSVAIPANS